MDKDLTKTILPANVNVIIKGRMVIMKPISQKEINEHYISWLNNPETNKFLEVRHKKQSIEDVINYINILRTKPCCELFAVFTKKEHIHIGNVAITHYNPDNQGYAIYGLLIGDPRARMLGLGGEVTVLIIEYLFRNPDIRRIQGGVIADNYSAWRVLESSGFKREGVLRKHAVLLSGKICDIYIYGMLREEWLSNRAKVAPLLKDRKVQDYSEGNFM